MVEVAPLLKPFEGGGPPALFHRLDQLKVQGGGVEVRRAGLAESEISAAAHLYSQGWSLARLGAKYGVDQAY
jgi:hypothetical protein